jgi:hypothetical protein
MSAVVPTPSPADPPIPAKAGRRDGLFPRAGYLFVLFFMAALVAFWPGYLSKLPGGGFYRHLHAVVMTLWFGLLIAQPLLIRSGRRPLHRLLGKSAFVLAPLAVVSMILGVHSRMLELKDPLQAYYAVLPLAIAMLFAVAVTLALVYRKQPALHARFMICTGLALIDPVGARLLGYYFPPLPDWAYQGTTFTLTDLLLLFLIWREWRAPRGRAAFPVMLAVAIPLQVTVFVLPYGPAWQSAIQWFRALPLT